MESAKSQAASAKALLRKAKGKKHSVIKTSMADKLQIQNDLRQSKIAYDESCTESPSTSEDTSQDAVHRSGRKHKLDCQEQQMKINTLKKLLQSARQTLRTKCKAVHGAVQDKEEADLTVI